MASQISRPATTLSKLEKPGPVGWLSFAIWSVVALLLVVIEILLLPFTVGRGIHIPISVLLVVLGNSLIPRVMSIGTGVRWAWVVPAILWVLIVFPASMVTADGDALLPGKTYSATWNMIYLGVGAATALFGAVFARTDFTAWREHRSAIRARRKPASRP